MKHQHFFLPLIYLLILSISNITYNKCLADPDLQIINNGNEIIIEGPEAMPIINDTKTSEGPKFIKYDANKKYTDKELGISKGTNEILNKYFHKNLVKILANSNIPDKNLTGRVYVNFEINKDGSITNVVLRKSSGDTTVDNAALKAVKMSSPLDSLPTEPRYSKVSISFPFLLSTYNYKHLSNKDFKNIHYDYLNYTQNTKNPINHQYKKEHGDYIYSCIDIFNQKDINIKNYHHKKFPITYWVENLPDDKATLINKSIDEYKQYLPLKQIDNKHNADITIELDKKGITQYGVCGTKMSDNSFKSTVYLSPKIFEYPLNVQAKLTIKHEFAHALGLTGHSDSPYDILYPKINTNCEYGEFQCTIEETGQLKSADQFGEFSERDLNTLWLLYNQW